MDIFPYRFTEIKYDINFKFLFLETLVFLNSLHPFIERLVKYLIIPLNRSNFKLLNHRYVIYEKIGSGGMSEIFTGYDRDHPTCIGKFKPVAIKVLSPEFIECNEAIYSFETEYLIGQQLSHQSIVKFFDFVSDGTNYFLVMERLVGKTLNSIKNENRNLFTFELRISLLEKIINGLAYIHSRSIAHGDLKPSNIFICNDGTLKIIDFGLSSGPNRRPPNTAYAFSAKFASPERILGNTPSYRDDIYALGCIAHIILTGSHPFGNISSIEAQRSNLTPPKILGVDENTQIIIDEMLSFDPINRPSNAVTLYSSFSYLFD